MSRKLTFLSTAAAATLFAVGSASAAIVMTPLNVREEPHPAAPILGVLDEGTEVECTAMIGNWCELLDGEGYVYAAYLDFDEVDLVEEDIDVIVEDEFDDDFDAEVDIDVGY